MSQIKNNSNSFLRHFLSIGSGTVISMIISLITTPIITRIVEPEIYGQLSIFTMYTSISVMVLCLGLDQALVRFFYDYESLEYKKALLKLCIGLPIILTTLVSCIIIALSFVFNVKFEFDKIIMLLLCCNVIITIWNRISILVLRITYSSKKYSYCLIIQKIVYVIFALMMVYSKEGDHFFELILALILSIFVPTIYATLSEWKYWDFKNKLTLENQMEIIKYGAPFILSMGITQIFQALDKISLNTYKSYADVGVYASAMTLVNIFAIIQTTFNTLWGPMQVEHYVQKPEDTSFIQRGNEYITIIMFFIGINLMAFRNLFAFLLGPQYRNAATILPFLCFSPIMYTISETTCSGIGLSKKSYLNIVVALISCLVNFVGNTLLVPRFGGEGAAISTGISYIVFFIVRTVLSNKFYYIDYHLKKLSLLTFSVIGYAVVLTFQLDNWIQWIMYLYSILILVILYKPGIYSGWSKLKIQIDHLLKWNK